MLFLYIMVAGAQLKLRARTEAEAPERLQIKMWFHPWGTLFALAAMFAVLIFMGLSPDLSEQLWLSLVIAVLLTVAFFVFRRKAWRA
jgi:GABA permease